ncbi:MAG: alpha/beta hydrolase family protein, partial [Christensenellaceae bacterium]
MANAIMTPLSLWKDFDDSLSLDPFRVRREEKDGILYEYVYFSGRKTNEGRVRIYGLFARPVTGESFPAVLFLPDAGKDFDLGFINRYVRMGYCVFSVDYSGRCDREKYTQYPNDIVYANYADVGRHMDFVDTDAMGTSWYEWTAVGRYAIRYLRSRPEVARIGVVGVRTGGELVWKLLLSSEVSCGIPICAAGWLAYRGVNKLEGGMELSANDERQRFIAGIDS